ncbi:MAG: DUF885 family protein [Acidobacteriaceae bacterium]
MKKLLLCSTLAMALSAIPMALGQQFPKGTVVHYPPRGPVTLQQTAAPLAQREKQLHAILAAIRQYRLKTHPEYATLHGDHRYDADLTDYSAAAWQQRLNQANAFMMQLAQIDTTGMSPADQKAAENTLHRLIAEQTAGASRPWETPVTATSGLPFSLAALPAQLHFATAQDYDHYIARLNKIPTAFRQVSDDILLGMQDENPPSAATIQGVLAQVKAVTSQKPQDSPFAEPLQHFPASVSAADQARIRKAVLAAISTQVFPAYQRFGRFIESLQQPAPPPASKSNSPSNKAKVHP